MRQLFLFFIGFVLASAVAIGDEFRLKDGKVYRGKAASFTKEGVVIRLEERGFSPRLPWVKLTQKTLMQIAERYPNTTEYVAPHLRAESLHQLR